MMNDNQRLLTVKDLAVLLRCSRNHAERLVLRGEIASMKLGRSRRIAPAAVRAYLERRQRETMAEMSV